MKIIESFLTRNPFYTAGRTITVKGFMLHSIGCSQPRASVFVKNWNKETYTRACVHAFIDANTGDVYQTLPWNRRAGHSGGSANNTHIGVEMCEPACIKYTGKGAEFTVAKSDFPIAREAAKCTYDSAVELFAHLCTEYKLDPLSPSVIISHKEGGKLGKASAHADPEHLWTGLGMSYTMDTFRQAVSEKINGTKTGSTVQSSLSGQTTGTKGNCTVTLPILCKGSKGDDVVLLQNLLNIHGCTDSKGHPLATDGSFGPATQYALANFQSYRYLKADCLCGPATWTELLKFDLE